MKHVKSLLALVLTLMLICGMAVVPAAAAEGTLVGDAKLFLPSTGPIKVQYTLTSDGTTAVADAAYSITKVENADDSEIAAADIWQYAQIDAATGELYVSQAAKGKEIFLSASTADYTGSTSVVVNATSLSTDFENDAAIDALFGAGTAATAGRIVTEENGNRYATGLGTGWNGAGYVSISPEQLAAQKLNIEADMKVTHHSSTASSGSYNMPVKVVFNPVTISTGEFTPSHYIQITGDSAGLSATTSYYWMSTSPVATTRTSTIAFDSNYESTDDMNAAIAKASFRRYKWTISSTLGLTRSLQTLSVDGSAGDRVDYQMYQFDVPLLNTTTVKSIQIFAPTDNLEIYSGERASATMFESASVVGDSKLFLPSSGTIKVQYGMETRSGEAITEGVTYSISGDGVASYAKMDATTGELLIDAKALNKTFTVKAATADAEATMEVTTGSFRYATDFQDGTIPSWITNGNNVSVATLSNGNKFAPFKAGSWGNPGGAAINFTGSGFAPQVLTVEAKFRSAGIGDVSGSSIYNPVVPFKINYDTSFMGNTYWDDATHKEWPVMTYIRAYNTGEGTAKVLAPDYRNYTVSGSGETGAHVDDSSRWQSVGTYTYTGTYTKGDVNGNGLAFSDDFSFTSAKMVVKNDKIYVSIDGANAIAEDFISNVTDIETGEDVSVIGVPLTSIQFGTPIDDLEIYSGEKIAGAWAISGDDFLIAPYKSTSATSFNYSATPELPWADQNATVTWGLASNYAGASIDANGKLTITGDTPTGNITIQAKDESGVVVGEKTLEIFRGQKNTYYWIDNRTFFQDFEKYDVGSKDLDGRMGNGDDDGSLIGSSNWNDFLIVPGSNAPSKGVGTVVQEDNGNKYISTYGRKWWTTSADGAGLYLDINDNAYTDTTSSQTYVGEYFVNEETVNLEADFMFDSEWVVKMDPVWTSWSLITGNSDTFDIFYKKLTDETVGVYLGVVDGVVAETGAPLIAVMPVDTWFSLKLEQNNATKAINVYINGRLVAENVVVTKMTSNLANHQWWIGASVDNIQLYSGSATAAAANTEFKIGNTVENVGFATDYAMTEGANVVSVTLGEAAPAGVSDDAKLLIAQYSGGKMVKMTSVPVTVVNGKLYGCAALTAEYAAGDTVKVFLWNWGTLQPVK